MAATVNDQTIIITAPNAGEGVSGPLLIQGFIWNTDAGDGTDQSCVININGANQIELHAAPGSSIVATTTFETHYTPMEVRGDSAIYCSTLDGTLTIIKA